MTNFLSNMCILSVLFLNTQRFKNENVYNLKTKLSRYAFFVEAKCAYEILSLICYNLIDFLSEDSKINNAYCLIDFSVL